MVFVLCEPSCSKFDYEQKLLEKMIRMEFEVQNLATTVRKELQEMRQDITDMENSVSEELSDLNEEREKLRGNVSSFEGRQETVFHSMKQITQELNKSMELYRSTPTSELRS